MAGGVSPRECPARAPILAAEKERRRTKADPADHVSPLSPFIMAAAAAGARPIITESEGGDNLARPQRRPTLFAAQINCIALLPPAAGKPRGTLLRDVPRLETLGQSDHLATVAEKTLRRAY